MKKTLSKILKENLYLLLLILILIVIISLNIHPGKLFIGFDNISPYFGSKPILDKVFSTSTDIWVIPLSPLLLVMPFFEGLKLISIPAWAINQLYYFGCLVSGAIGAFYFAKLLFKKQYGEFPAFFGSMIYLTSLVMVWTFNQPNFLFLAAYGSIPWLLYLVNRAEWKKRHILLYSLMTIIFLQVSNNLVAFLTYTTSVIALSLLIETSSARKPLKKIFLSLAPLIFWGFIIQLILLIKSSDLNLLTLIIDHGSLLGNADLTEKITNSIIESVNLRNNLMNSFLYAGNWFENHDLNNVPLFQFYSLYSYTPFIVLGFLPLIFSLGYPYMAKKEKGYKKYLMVAVLLSGVFLSSKYFLYIIEPAQTLTTALRWSASKFWPLVLFPQLILSVMFTTQWLKHLSAKGRLLLKILSTTTLLLFALPVFTGNLISQRFKQRIPEEYYDLAETVSENTEAKFIYLPNPQQLYFYQYEWGYFGSSFLTYLSEGDAVRNGIYDYFYNAKELSNLENGLISCNSKIDREPIYIIDSSIKNGVLEPESIQYCLELQGFEQIKLSENLSSFTARE